MRSARSTKMTSNSHLEQAKGGGWCTAATWAAAATVREHGGGAANLQEMASQIFVRAAWKRITGSGSAVGFASWALESTAAVGSAARRSRMIVPESRRESRLSAPQKGTVCVLTPQGIFKGSLLRKTPTLSLAGAFWRAYHSAQATARPGENSSEPARDTQPKTRNTSEHRPSRPVRRAELQ